MALILLNALSLCCQPQCRGAEDGRWTTAWATATENIVKNREYSPKAPLAHNTYRMFVRTSIGGELLRFRFSNVYGTNSATINAAHFALAANVDSSAENGSINTNSDTAIQFNGASSVVIPSGETVVSDPVKFALPPLSLVAVSIHYGEIANDPITGHRGSRTTSFFKSGNVVSDADMAGATKQDVWFTLVGMEVMTPMSGGTIVAIGDSITDGNSTRYNYHTRWTDFLATRLSTNSATAGVGVANMGIGATGIDLAKSRFQRDVLEQGGARWVIIFIGVNDIGANRPASFVTSAYTDMASRAHARGLKVYGATITPFHGNGYYSEAHEAARQEVNAWIKTTAITNGVLDGFMDFSECVTAPGSNPPTLQSTYTGDHLHLNPAGYKALSDGIDLSLFAKP
ncbi:MAG TPA: GDSL-type esterase/lipase family protein [Candidatus Paceibacterota bacterium]|nr:GDSL-type esterase/lipase family protein [Candidatus Paceibacterota bacterium]